MPIIKDEPPHIDITKNEPSVGDRFKPVIPFEQYRIATVVKRHDKRNPAKIYKYVLLSGSSGPNKVVSLGRYVYAIHCGQDLKETERLVFKDGNPNNTTLDNLEVLCFAELCAHPLKENPEIGTRFKPEPPYEKYDKGVVRKILAMGKHRRQVELSGPDGIHLSTKCARYLKTVDHYKKTGEIINDPDIHAHHVNENPMDDRLENLEWKHRKEHGLYHFNAMFHDKIIKRALLCPVCKKLFTTVAAEKERTIPRCCNIRCDLTLMQTLQPIEEYRDLLQKLAHSQEVFIKSDGNFLDYDLSQLVNKPVQYGPFHCAPEEEQIQQIRDFYLKGWSFEQIAGSFSLSVDRVAQLYEIGQLHKRTIRTLLKVRKLLSEGFNHTEIGKEIQTSQANVSMFIRKHRNHVYPL